MLESVRALLGQERNRQNGPGPGARYPGCGGWDWGCRHAPPGPLAAGSQTPLRTRPNRSAFLSLLPPLCGRPPQRPWGGAVVGSRPLGPRPGREVPGSPALTARLRLRLRLRAERCPEAQLDWRGLCSCRKITPEPDLCALGPARRANTASFRVADFCKETRFLPGCNRLRTSGVCAKPRVPALTRFPSSGHLPPPPAEVGLPPRY